MDSIDARGLKCPLPVLRAEKHIESMGPGEAVLILATDPVARIDIPHFCNSNGHACVLEERADALAFTITKDGAAARKTSQKA